MSGSEASKKTTIRVHETGKRTVLGLRPSLVPCKGKDLTSM